MALIEDPAYYRMIREYRPFNDFGENILSYVQGLEEVADQYDVMDTDHRIVLETDDGEEYTVTEVSSIWTHDPAPSVINEMDLTYDLDSGCVEAWLDSQRFRRQRFIVHVDGGTDLRDTVEDATGEKLYRPGWQKVLDWLR